MRRLPVILIVSAMLPAIDASAEEATLVVRLTSGRHFTGTLDPASTREELVLRTEASGISMRRPIRWERVVEATLDGEPVEVERLRERSGFRVPGSEGAQQRGDEGQGTVVDVAPVVEVEELPIVQPEVWVVPRRATAVTFDARVASWGAGVETDGLVLDLAPLDSGGFVAPVSGTLTVELFAPQRRAFHHAPLSGGSTLELVERWHRAVNAEEFGPYGVRVRLPFGAVHPELDPYWTAWHYGLVHVRLAAPGHGTLSHSIDGIRIRPWAPNRDRLQLDTGRRFLPTESLNRSPRWPAADASGGR